MPNKPRTDADRARRSEQRRANPHETWAAETLSNIRRRAKKRGYEVDITKEWMLDNLSYRCPLLGIKFIFSSGKIVDGTPTVDRKDSTKGYTQDNCWIISAKANRIKTNASISELKTFAANISKLDDDKKK